MGHWRVRLIGNRFDLTEFPALFTSPNFLVVEEDKDYFLESEYLDTFEDVGDVHKAAVRLLQILNAVVMLWIGNFRKVQMSSISRMNADGIGEGALFHSTDAIIVARSKISATGTVGDATDEPAPPGSRETDKWAALAMRDEAAEQILRIWSTRPHDWVNLSNVLDVIGRPQIRKKKWATKGGLRRFDQSANDPRHASDDARHGVPSDEKTPQRPYMSPVEAERFVEGIIIGWLRSIS